MSGGLEDGMREYRRSEERYKFMQWLYENLVKKQDCGSQIPLWGIPANESEFCWSGRGDKFVSSAISKLIDGDLEEWSLLLTEVVKSTWLLQFKKISPFADRTIVLADYGHGFVNYYGEWDQFISSELRKKGLGAYNGQKHLILLPTKILRDNLEVYPEEQ